MDVVDCVVIGAGVVGLAAAHALQKAGREVLILEQAATFGTGISSRNSEVIHAGLYYPPGTLMAETCREGRDRLYAFCREHGVTAKRLGKLVVATSDTELDTLARIDANARAIGTTDLQPLTAKEAQALEPELTCAGALLSPSTGIVDGHGLMLALLGAAEAKGAQLVTQTPVQSAHPTPQGLCLSIGGKDPFQLTANLVINAAGHGAIPFARSINALATRHVPKAHFSKGNYFALKGRSPFSRLIYPVPVPGGAGTHLTLDLGGQARFGPDVEPVDRPDEHVDPDRARPFYAAIRRYWPALPDDALEPAYCGIRPKIVPATERQDFVIQPPDVHGIPGLINLFGIESPGLTASLALAERIVGIAKAAS